jgi:membrane protease YdiL (CAAX protease family)
LPEELLFRGVVYKLLVKQFQGKKWAVGNAMIVSSLIFGLTRGNSATPPYWDLSFGNFGIWHFPWAYVLLSSVAGYFYALVFIRTQKITAAAILHLLVDWTWLIFFHG